MKLLQSFVAMTVVFLVIVGGLTTAIAIVSSKSKPLQDEIRELVQTVSTFLSENNVAHMAVFGTLLGLYREKDIIPGDDDGDVAIRAEDAKRVMGLDWGSVGLFVTAINEHCGPKKSVKVEDAALLRVYSADHRAYCDVYIIDKNEEDKTWRFRIKDECNSFPDDMLFPVEATVNLAGVAIPVVHDPEGFLFLVYGPDFMTPRSYKGKKCNREKFGSTTACH